MNPKYKKKFIKGTEYQDFLTEYLYKIGLPLFTYTSKKWQTKKGENKLGVEIKFDDKHKETGNLYIEIQERTETYYNYVPSGIFRNDNTWIYIQGNYDIAYVFFKKHLKSFYKTTGINRIKEIQEKTSKGFLLYPKEIQQISGYTLNIKKGE